MGTLTRKFANNFTVGGVYKPAAINNASLNNVTDIPAAAKGKLTLISSQTASASASISFTSGIDSTYHTYLFKFVDIHPATDDVNFTFNMSTDSGSNYNVTKTTTFFDAYHNEADTDTALTYETARDLAQSTAFKEIGYKMGNNNDDNFTGSLQLFNPSSTTYVKHFIANTQYSYRTGFPMSVNAFSAGYGNTTSAVNAIQFKFSSGNIDAGTIYMYGVGA
jgi:hypothetical protein